MATGFTEATAALTNEAATIFTAKERSGLVIGNASDTVMTVRFSSSAATAAIGIPIAAGAALEFRDPRACPRSAVSLFCAGTSKTYTAYEW